MKLSPDIYWPLGPTVPYLKINLAAKRLPYFVAFLSGNVRLSPNGLPSNESASLGLMTRSGAF